MNSQRNARDLTNTYGTIAQTVLVGGGHALLVMADDCIRFAHDCDRRARFPNSDMILRIAPALQFGAHTPTSGPRHQVTIIDNADGFPVITVDPSILCEDCGTHGYVRNGRWSDI